MFRGTANEYMSKFKNENKPKTKRTNWKKEIKAEREKVINETISHLKEQLRDVPMEWKRGYYSAITKLEIMKIQNEK